MSPLVYAATMVKVYDFEKLHYDWPNNRGKSNTGNSDLGSGTTTGGRPLHCELKWEMSDDIIFGQMSKSFGVGKS